MKLLLTKYLLLSFLAISFSATKSFGQLPSGKTPSSLISVDTATPLLYHASFKVLKYHFTGLIVFKNISEEEGIRIVFLSEAGLSIAEFSYLNNQVECLKTLPMVDKGAAKRYLSRIIFMVLYPGNCDKLKVKTEEENTSYICKGKKGKHYYIYQLDKHEQSIYKKGFSKKAVAFLSHNNVAQLIEIRKRKKVKVKMKIVENAIK